MHEESANGCGSVDSAKGVLDVSGDEKFVGCSKCHGAKVVNHAVSTAFHEGAILIRSNSTDDIRFGDVKYDTSGQFEEHFEKSDWPDARARFLAKWFDLPDKPQIGNVLWYCALSPGKHPEPSCLDAVWCFEKGSNVSVACF